MIYLSWEVFLSISRDLANKGELTQKKDHLVFFSNDHFKLDHLLTPYNLLHQVHGNKIIEAKKDYPLADGHWTTKKNLALIIKTADCLPVFLYGEGKAMALHIGWRGFTNNILLEALKHFKNPQKVHVSIGPHIGYKSFQVNESIALDIMLAQNLSWNKVYKNDWVKKSYLRPKHLFINLQAILINSLREQGIKNITTAAIDTCTSPHHYSHRRNPRRTGTNYSFIMKT